MKVNKIPDTLFPIYFTKVQVKKLTDKKGQIANYKMARVEKYRTLILLGRSYKPISRRINLQ
mgnify:CR=1 FL=1